jgi:predicted kinase
MEMIIFCGIQAAGKSTFYKERFFNSHVRISLDLLNTRNKELIFLKTCLQLQQRIVIDNTNPTKLERKKYIELARQYNYQVTGYFFQSKIRARKKSTKKVSPLLPTNWKYPARKKVLIRSIL